MEVGRQWVNQMLADESLRLVVSELADVEVPSLLCRAQRNGTISDEVLQARLGLYDTDTSGDGPLAVLRLTPKTFTMARQIALDEPVGSLDAIHLAAALLLQRQQPDQPVTVVTLDRRQAVAARRLGFRVVSDLHEAVG